MHPHTFPPASVLALMTAYNRASRAWHAAGFPPPGRGHPTRAAMVAAFEAYRDATRLHDTGAERTAARVHLRLPITRGI